MSRLRYVLESWSKDSKLCIANEIGPSAKQLKHWADFAKAADNYEHPAAQDGSRPFILVSSLTQEKLDSTPHIDETVPTQLASVTWQELKDAFINLSGTNDSRIFVTHFQILDEKSVIDHNTVFIEKGLAWIKSDGSEAESEMDPDAVKHTVWRKYRAPFEEAWTIHCATAGFCGTEILDEYLVEDVEKDIYVEEEVEESSEETDSDETTSEDLEYGDFPIKSK